MTGEVMLGNLKPQIQKPLKHFSMVYDLAITTEISKLARLQEF